MDDTRVSTIKCGAIKQFHHYKIHTNASEEMIESNEQQKKKRNNVLTVGCFLRRNIAATTKQTEKNNKVLVANLFRSYTRQVALVEYC